MTKEFYVKLVKFPNTKVKEAVTHNPDGTYTIFLDERLSSNEAILAYNHAVQHIYDDDFEKFDVSSIENIAHAR